MTNKQRMGSMLTCIEFFPVLLLDLRKQRDLPALQAKTEYSECLSSRQKTELDDVQRGQKK